MFARGVELLRAEERGVLPFAREPWTRLREDAERILACLEGKPAGPGR
ncbi:MAG: hypothetical protein IRZ00_12550 [Gemmatimonadetes bacterium]|nr:hypothetical protein [Gemmatimonadota bacterium]